MSSSPPALLLTSGLIWRSLAPCALTSQPTASSSRRRSEFSSGAIARLATRILKTKTDFLLTVAHSSDSRFVKTLSAEKTCPVKSSRRGRVSQKIRKVSLQVFTSLTETTRGVSPARALFSCSGSGLGLWSCIALFLCPNSALALLQMLQLKWIKSSPNTSLSSPPCPPLDLC